MMRIGRRRFTRVAVCSAALPVLSQLREAAGAGGQSAHIATNTYPWMTFARREKKPFMAHSDQLLADIASTGIVGYEPIVETASELDGLGQRLDKHRLQMRSIYVNSVLHEPAKVDESIAKVISIAKSARNLGTRIVVTNPSPIRWGGDEDKSDSQLRLQSRSLDQLGGELRKLDVTLAYHNHDAELRQGGREFHHMLTATRPENVKFCLDAHWVFRGCGDSEVAVFDALSNYHDRIVELHLRQSHGGLWTEAFAMKGDVDYTRLMAFLGTQGISPHLVLEQAVEEGSTTNMLVVEAHRAGRDNLASSIG